MSFRLGREMAREHRCEESGSVASRDCLNQRPANDLFADALDLQIKLNPGDAVLRAGDLEVHVAEVIFVAEMSVSSVPLVGASLDQTDRDAGDRVGNRHACGHQPKVAPQTLKPWTNSNRWTRKCRK